MTVAPTKSSPTKTPPKWCQGSGSSAPSTNRCHQVSSGSRSISCATYNDVDAMRRGDVQMSKGRVGVLTTHHIHDDGRRIIYGGAERYGIEFTKLLLEMGYEVAWWQAGSGWTSEVVPGVPLYSTPMEDARSEERRVGNESRARGRRAREGETDQ